jgi:hypothetical protein
VQSAHAFSQGPTQPYRGYSKLIPYVSGPVQLQLDLLSVVHGLLEIQDTHRSRVLP